MPKTINTRQQRADELLERLRRGPSIGIPHDRLTSEEITKEYRLWAESWILNDLIALVPELRRKKEPQ